MPVGGHNDCANLRGLCGRRPRPQLGEQWPLPILEVRRDRLKRRMRVAGIMCSLQEYKSRSSRGRGKNSLGMWAGRGDRGILVK